ncbi:Phosphate transport system permease protein PstC [Planctomycetes bacterium Pan216]|uniref:Phosphate transport system permease protein PstC n=1 Tax=Kolteria novifilia TaxID=2527975 RepID=A0A518AZD3_9BACT|nr:Phosphate transport system permease protein PstC [Planctomycetes bacterium Pan216]
MDGTTYRRGGIHLRKRSAWYDRIARTLISACGLGVFVVLGLMLVLLAATIYPLISQSGQKPVVASTHAWSVTRPIHLILDDRRQLGAAILSTGTICAFRTDNGDAVNTWKAFPNRKLTCAAFTSDGREAIFGFDDGTAQVGHLSFQRQVHSPENLPEGLASLPVGESAVWRKGLVRRLDRKRFESTDFVMTLDNPIAFSPHIPISLVAIARSHDEPRFAVLSETGPVILREGSIERRLPLSADANAERGTPTQLLLSSDGASLFVGWRSGDSLRWNTASLRDLAPPELANLVGGDRQSDATLTAMLSLSERRSFVSGDSLGRVRRWRESNREGGSLALHPLPSLGSPVTSMTTLPGGTLLAVGCQDGTVALMHLATGRLVTRLSTDNQRSIQTLAIAPHGDGLCALTMDAFWYWNMADGVPSGKLSSLFVPVWVDAATANLPDRSSTRDIEPTWSRFGLFPLFFGTIKAALCAILFGAPLAILSAIYTSEYLKRSARSSVRSAIDLLASIPSVVFGLVAIVFVIPFAAAHLAAFLAALATIPIAVLVGAHLQPLLPKAWASAVSRWRFVVIGLLLAVGGVLAIPVGNFLESWLFAGDTIAWLDGTRGSATGAWLLLLLPASAVVTSVVVGCFVYRPARRTTFPKPRRDALGNLARFLGGAVVAWSLAFGIAWAMTSLEFDPRGAFLGPYMDRNAFLVGIVLGIAIVPTIFSIAEEAFSSVPHHWRAASLGSGATPWQTAVHIVAPVAMSGLASALLIGLGRALGETMIVLMATGNQPLTSWNVFEGLRSLTADIALEMPSAIPDSNHFRVLVLATLLLLLLTVAINTIAELIRLRLRGRYGRR